MTKTIKQIIVMLMIVFAMLTAMLMTGCGKTTVFEAAEKGDIETVTAYLDSHPGAFKESSYGRTLLHRAARGGQTELVELLLKRGAEIDRGSYKDGSGPTALMLAAAHGRLETVRLLIKKGADVDLLIGGRGYRTNALNYAARNGHKEVVELLIREGAQVKPADKRVMSPLVFAAYRGEIEMVRLLVRHGADVDAALKNGSTALHYAVMMEQKEVLELLVSHGAAVNPKNSWDRTPLHMLVYWHRDRTDMARLLLEKGALVNHLDKNKSTLLHYAAFNRFAGTAELLLEKGAEVHHRDDLGQTALGLAIERGGKAFKRKLLALHIAAGKKDGETFASLVKRFPQLIDCRDEDGKTPLHHAAENNRIKNAQLLIAAGADIHAVSWFKRYPLLNGVIAKLLVPDGGRTKRKHDRKTPLAMAARNGHQQMIEVLKNNGALR